MIEIVPGLGKSLPHLFPKFLLDVSEALGSFL